MTRQLSNPRHAARLALGAFLAYAGISHLSFAREEFQAQVPPSLPLDPDLVVIVSGVAEVGLGVSLLALLKKRVHVGWIVALFFVAVFPGNIAQLLEHRDAFGLDTDGKRLARLFFQPVLIALALWATGAWRDRDQLRTKS
ncbi:DoxX family membrane protein [Glutamicibacter sp. FBE19]|uniref:DoxX family protein n=1 Tax=Glutamicibacter sp. FBE19 TaxID=2761534 RepID=UPI001896584E|nr:DoxX family membrane protein [Glutamicibacter sp. FBE19]MBF6671366.1 DoxX family membrane protein [Glutamicibacter sp. FBE19]